MTTEISIDTFPPHSLHHLHWLLVFSNPAQLAVAVPYVQPDVGSQDTGVEEAHWALQAPASSQSFCSCCQSSSSSFCYFFIVCEAKGNPALAGVLVLRDFFSSALKTKKLFHAGFVPWQLGESCVHSSHNLFFKESTYWPRKFREADCHKPVFVCL